MKKNKGFTLIEVLVALCIIAIALTAVLHATLQAIRTNTHLRTTLTAHWVGSNVLSQIQTGLIPLPDSGEIPPGQTDMLGRTWFWSATTESSEVLPDLTKIHITVQDDQHRSVGSVQGYIAL